MSDKSARKWLKLFAKKTIYKVQEETSFFYSAFADYNKQLLPAVLKHHASIATASNIFCDKVKKGSWKDTMKKEKGGSM